MSRSNLEAVLMIATDALVIWPNGSERVMSLCELGKMTAAELAETKAQLLSPSQAAAHRARIAARVS